MKNPIRYVILGVLVGVSLGLCAMQPGCGTTPATAIYDTEATTITTVDSAMQAWADYVNAGNATAGQVAAVKSAYGTYYDAQELAHSALDAYLASQTQDTSNRVAQATAAASGAAAALIDLVQPLVAQKAKGGIPGTNSPAK